MTFIDAHRARFGVEPICRMLELAPSTYYARRTGRPPRAPSPTPSCWGGSSAVHAANYVAYGSRRMWRALRRQGHAVGRGRVERVMREHGICGAQRRARRRFLTRADDAAPRPADLVERRFVAERPNELWVCDLTYLKTYEGFLYLAFVKDVFSRMIVGWQTAADMRTDLVLDALEMAVHRRRPRVGELVHHTDRGSQPGLNRSSQQCVREMNLETAGDCSAGVRGGTRWRAWPSSRRLARRAGRSGDSHCARSGARRGRGRRHRVRPR